MQTLQRVRRTAMVLVAASTVMACWVPPVSAQPPAAPLPSAADPIVPVTTKRVEVQITERFSKVLQFQNRVTRVDGFDPDVVNVTALTPAQLRLQALHAGVTTVVVVDELNEVYTLDVFVLGDVRQLQLTLNHMFTQSAVEVVPIRDTVVLRGWVTQPEHVEEIMDVTRRFYPEPINQLRVGGVQQVQLNVKVMEVQRSKIRNLGINFLYGDSKGAFGLTPGKIVQLGTLGASATNPATAAATAGTLSNPEFAGALFSGTRTFNGFVNSLKQEGLLKILAEPKLTTTNGRPAYMLAGGEFPILVPQNFNVTIAWKEFGVKMEAVPFILGGGRLRLQLQPEVSERDFTSAVTFNGITVPGLTTRRVNTEVEMQFGETLMLAGLLSTRKTAQTFKVPYLGDVPWLGAAFRKVSYNDSETELVILVTPELVAPVDCLQLPPGGPGLFSDDPTDKELYQWGLLEVPRFGDHCEGGVCPPGPAGPGMMGPGPVGPGPIGPGAMMPGAPQPMPGLLPPQPGMPVGPAAEPPIENYPSAVPPSGVPTLPGTIETAPPAPPEPVPGQGMTATRRPKPASRIADVPPSGGIQPASHTQPAPARKAKPSAGNAPDKAPTKPPRGLIGPKGATDGH